jgi:3-oxoacyl-[acyl-carrier protein] reductase
MTPRTVLVTGAARGIGLAIAQEYRRRGHEVLAPTRAELDLAESASVQNFVRENSGRTIDVLINNAGINQLNAIEAIDEAVWAAMLQVNLTSALRLAQAFLPGMAQRGWGRVLGVSSIFSLATKNKRAAYSMTKAALNALVRSIAVEYGPHGILANALCPGFVETDLTRQNNSPQELAALAETVPLRRLAQPEEIARVACFLASDENSYLTGQAVVVDGGFLCQ